MTRKVQGVAAPREDLPDLPDEFVDHTTLAPHGTYEGSRWSSLESFEGDNATIRESRFDSVSVDTLSLKFSALTDVVVHNARIASFALRGARLARVVISGGRIGTLDLTDADVDAVVIDGTRIDYLTLGRASVTDLDIRSCRIDSLDLPAAKLSRVRFSASQANEFDPREASAKDVDLRGLDFASVSDARALAGMTISAQQAEIAAVQFAAALGVRVQN